MSKSAVDGVTDAVKAVSEISKLAQDVKAELEKEANGVTEALQLTREHLTKPLRGAGADLRGALGILTNNPPSDN